MSLMFAMIMVTLFTTNCTKDAPLPDPEVQFSLNPAGSGGFKSGMEIPVCVADWWNQNSLIHATYVKYIIDGSSDFKTIPVFYDAITGVPWTNSIKLAPGTHTISEFYVYSDNLKLNDPSDDVFLAAVPHTGSEFAKYVSSPLNQTFTIINGKKLQVPLDVVCYSPGVSGDFGFVYFDVLHATQVRDLYFFGDFCIKDKSEYASSLYGTQSNWGSGSGFIDAPAITKIEVWKNGSLAETFSSTKEGEKLRITYADELGKTDAFEIKLFILVKQGNAFNYVQFKSWTFNDVSNIPQGTDGLIDFVLGNCYDPATPPDLILAPWLNLPSTVTYTITAQPSTLGGYVDATLTNAGLGYDIHNGIYGSYCADHSTTIYVNQSYNMNVYSSLHPELLPVFAQSNKWNKINWLFNNLSRYPGYLWSDIQGFIWLYDNPVWLGGAESGMPPLTALSTQMKTDADNYGATYSPPPGGWAAIIFIPVGTPANATTAAIQTMFVRIDP